jgi:hypothetical protein
MKFRKLAIAAFAAPETTTPAPEIIDNITTDVIETNPGEFSTVTGMDTAEVVAEVPAASSEAEVTVTLSKRQAAKAAKAAKAILAATASEPATEPATLADLADLPNFAVPGETAAPAAKKSAAPKAAKVPAEKTANQQIVFAMRIPVKADSDSGRSRTAFR